MSESAGQIPMACGRCDTWLILQVLENGEMWIRCPQCKWMCKQEQP